jgi:hypothetical protein
MPTTFARPSRNSASSPPCTERCPAHAAQAPDQHQRALPGVAVAVLSRRNRAARNHRTRSMEPYGHTAPPRASTSRTQGGSAPRSALAVAITEGSKYIAIAHMRGVRPWSASGYLGARRASSQRLKQRPSHVCAARPMSRRSGARAGAQGACQRRRDPRRVRAARRGEVPPRSMRASGRTQLAPARPGHSAHPPTRRASYRDL